MIMKLKSHFKLEGGSEDGKKNPICASSDKSSSVAVGLRILTQIPRGKSNVVVVKPALKISLPTSRKHHGNSSRLPADQSCFLKSCHLCHKNLSLDKEVYMYRGDQGFCSIQCRDRQIVLDEMRELEPSTKQMIASCRNCSATSGRRETRLLLEDLRGRNKSPHQNQNHWAIVS
ncbi:uncharacterized protein LOC111318637 [Durio zibethinus]|uniref:Uncharacterized protein LOC111318637 n=1 Tax=Durio zibethinus TaxID=66656 RepID=A0A6P6BJF6_DURZI|nr:uncharacterized protein LOC111318637 [Durio zibethinus]